MVLALWLRITTVEPVASWFSHLDNVLYDLELKMLMSEKPGREEVVSVVDIDDVSLKNIGRWPWSRAVMAELVAKLQQAGAVVIAFDVVFTDPERNPMQEVLERLSPEQKKDEELLRELTSMLADYDHDKKFATQISQSDVVLGIIFHDDRSTRVGLLPKPAFELDAKSQEESVIPNFDSYTANIALFQESAGYGGAVTTVPDGDGVIRRTPLVVRQGSKVYLSLSLEAVRLFQLAEGVRLNVHKINEQQVLESIIVDKFEIPTDAVGRVIIPYRGPGKSFDYISARDVLEGTADTEKIAGRIILIGSSALGIADLKAAPVAPVYPGVEIHANIIDGILHHRFSVQPSWALAAESVAIFLSGFFCVFVFPFLGPIGLFILSSFIPVLLIGGNIFLRLRYGLILSPVIPVLLVVLQALLHLAYGYLFENRYKKLLKFMFGQYVPAAHVEQMMKNPGDYGMSGEEREMTVMFADIRNFTKFSESLAPQALKQLLNQFLTPMTKVIFENHGTIDKYVGDMIVAFWGAPLHDEHHAEHGVQAALAMVESAELLRKEFSEQGLPLIEIGIGLNTGRMTVGDMGSEYRRAYTVLGDQVNLASRLEGLSKFYHAKIVVGFKTMKANPKVVFRRLDRVRVKGRNDPEEVYEPLGLRNRLEESVFRTLDAYEEALEAYDRGQWERAIERFQTLHQKNPEDKLYQLYLERLEKLQSEQPPEGWDGVFTRQEK